MSDGRGYVVHAEPSPPSSQDRPSGSRRFAPRLVRALGLSLRERGLMMKRFELHREHDVSGVSGVGRVAEGVQFSDGSCVLRWLTERASTVMWSSIDDVLVIHGHGGATQIVWVD